MKRKLFLTIAAAIAIAVAYTNPASAQTNWGKALSGLVKAGQAMTISDEQMAQYVKASVAQMDKENTVLPASSPYSQRLARLTTGIKSADGIPLNFKVYQTKEINAFACPDGSVRVYTGLMDLMTDDELLGVVGHEIGHVLKRHSRNAFKNQLLTGALRDGLSAAGGRVGALSESMLGDMGEALINAKYSRKQENEADDCGYDFLVAHGKNPWGMVMAFRKLQSTEQSGSGTLSSYLGQMFSSHPDTEARIKHMSERCTRDGYTKPTATTSSSAKTGTSTAKSKSKTKTSSKKKSSKKSR